MSTASMLHRLEARTGIHSAALTGAIALGAIGASIAIALGNQPYFDLLNAPLQLRDPLARGALYSSYLLIIGGAVVITRPPAFGFRIGDSLGRWRLVLTAVVATMVLTAAVLAASSPTPYADAAWANEVVIVPFTEELVFRGVLLTVLLALFSRIYPARTAAILAVVINASAFGVAHAANLLLLPAAFVIPQVVYATGVGAVAAGVMLKTRSIYPAILVHAAVNTVVVAF